jgi:hypothetical protein
MKSDAKMLSAFVVMSFDPTFRDVYELGIKPACTDARVACERVDEQLFLQNILQKVYGEIRNADLIIGEMTGRNPNVFYEVGYAHGMGKPVILLTRTSDDIPFDLRQYPHIVYGGSITDLKKRLSEKVRWCVENPDTMLGPGEGGNDPELDQIGAQIEAYLKANGYTRMSFQRIEAVMKFPEERVRALIKQSPRKFRFALVKGNLPGIARIGNAAVREAP